MKTIILLLSALLLSSCQFKDQLKEKILNKTQRGIDKVEQKINQELQEDITPTDNPSQSNQDLLNEINQSTDPAIDSDLTELEKQLR